MYVPLKHFQNSLAKHNFKCWVRKTLNFNSKSYRSYTDTVLEKKFQLPSLIIYPREHTQRFALPCLNLQNNVELICTHTEELTPEIY